MAKRQCLLNCAIALVAMAGNPAWSCGLEEASDVAVQRIAMNLAFPGAASVFEATQKAQRSGVLARSRTAAPAHSEEDELRAEQALAKATARFQALAGQFSATQGLAATRPSISIVLLQHMLWSRLSPTGRNVLAEVHAAGPRPGDVVLVTDTPVLEALASRRIDFARAMEHGLIRMYGPPDAMHLARQWLAGGAPQIQSAVSSTGGRS